MKMGQTALEMLAVVGQLGIETVKMNYVSFGAQYVLKMRLLKV